MTIKERLYEYDLYDQSIIQHGFLENNRDYQIIGLLSGSDNNLEVQYVFKGCIKVEYKTIVKPEFYSLDDRLLDLNRQDEPDYPQAYIWGVNEATVFPGWILIEETEELKELGTTYGLEFYQVRFETNTYHLQLIFHDLDVKELRKIGKK
jgi:hypothetical protein